MDTPKLYVAMPLRGAMMHGATAVTMWRFFRDPHFTIAPQDGAYNEDVYRTRSRMARRFIETDCTHLLFIDSDVSCMPATIKALVACARPVVAAPYPKKHYRLKQEDGSQGYEPSWYPMGPQDGDFMPALCPMGCTLIERSVIEHVTAKLFEAYERRDWPTDYAPIFGDAADNKLTACLFAPIIGANPIHPEHPPNMWPEDFSFCMRCNRLGIPTVMHMGTGAYHHEGPLTFPMEEIK